ncbi:MAG: SGNH/GDSL hydrolase family protein [Actinomycetota bacterium]
MDSLGHVIFDSRRGLRVLLAVACLSLLAAACATGTEGSAEGSRSRTIESQPVYAAIGASETAGVGSDDPPTQAWPEVLQADALPEFRIVNLGISGATVEDALLRQLPEVRRVEPEVVTVWLNVNDLLRGVSPSDYGRALTKLLNELQALDPAQVLVANTPPLHNLPALRNCASNSSDEGVLCFLFEGLPPPREIRFLVTRYNEVIDAAVSRAGFTLVDLHSAGLEARQEGEELELISGDGFHPSTAGHRAIAEVFAAELDK